MSELCETLEAQPSPELRLPFQLRPYIPRSSTHGTIFTTSGEWAAVWSQFEGPLDLSKELIVHISRTEKGRWVLLGTRSLLRDTPARCFAQKALEDARLDEESVTFPTLRDAVVALAQGLGDLRAAWLRELLQ